MRHVDRRALARPDQLPRWLWPVARAVDELAPDDLAPRMPPPPRDARSSAVLMLFGDGPNGPDLLLTERSHTMRSHAGQIAFPGGSSDPGDADLVATALREAEEEVGVVSAGVDVFGILPALWLPPSNFSVTTVLGYWRDPSQVHPVDAAEVESVFRTPIDQLLDPVNRFSVRHPSGWVGPAFTVADGLTLWGFTAGVVARLFAYVGWERPWEETRLEPFPPVSGEDARAIDEHAARGGPPATGHE